MTVNYIKNVFFSKDDLAVIVTCFSDKGGLVFELQTNFQARSGITEASIGFLTMISSSCKTALRHTVPKQLKIFFRDNTPDLISSQKWTPHSPDVNPQDYSIWDILQELVYEGRHELFANLKDLETVIRDKWHDIDNQTVRKAIL